MPPPQISFSAAATRRMISVSTEAGTRGAHVVAWFLKHGRWPTLIRHRCDVKLCVNTEHMIEGTHAENHADAFERGLRCSGEDHWFAKLSNVQADTIRRRAASERVIDLAAEFDVHVDTISRIKHGHSRRYR